MKRILFVSYFLALTAIVLGQVNQSQSLLSSQEDSKEITEYMVKDYIAKEIIQTPDRLLIGIEIEAITASLSGELSTVLYRCTSQNKSGLIFCFWNKFFNKYNTKYQGYCFKNFPLDTAKDIMNKLANVIEDKDKIIEPLKNDFSIRNAVYRYDDLLFIFYKKDAGGTNFIRVLWDEYDSDWNQSNLLTTIRRFNKFFDIPKR